MRRETQRKWKWARTRVKRAVLCVEEKQFIAGEFIGRVFEITAQVEREKQTIRCELLCVRMLTNIALWMLKNS